MSKMSEPSRRTILAATAAFGALGLAASAVSAAAPAPGAAEGDDAIRPFRIEAPEEALVDLRRRLAATRWPDREIVADQSQGVQLATLQALVRYWETQHDWRKAEARLNGLPQFATRIDGLDIQFAHVRSRHAEALPLIMTHGWPGSVIELLNAVDPLTDPTAHGGRAEDAFHLVLPSMPGYGFSEKPREPGWNPDRIARAWADLMRRLGYTRYVAQGGDWGSPVSGAMARQKAAFDQVSTVFAKGSGYAAMMRSRPQTVGYGLTDSPAGLAAWMIDHDARSYGQIARVFAGGSEGGLTRDSILDNITLYWLTNSAASSARLYWENTTSVLNAAAQNTADISSPVAVTVFPGEVYRAPKSWTQRAYRNLVYFNEVDRGGHFAAWEQPGLFAAELREAFRPLRKAGPSVARP